LDYKIDLAALAERTLGLLIFKLKKMKTIFHYYYLFNKKILKDDEPFATTVFTLSLSQSFVFYFFINLFSTNFYCIVVNHWIMVTIVIILLFINYRLFNKSGRSRKIVKSKPMFFSNNTLTVIIVILFFLGTSSLMFWGPIYFKNILDNCH